MKLPLIGKITDGGSGTEAIIARLLSVLEYNALKGVLIFRNVDWYDDVNGPSYGEFFYTLKFEVTE